MHVPSVQSQNRTTPSDERAMSWSGLCGWSESKHNVGEVTEWVAEEEPVGVWSVERWDGGAEGRIENIWMEESGPG